MGSTVIGGMLVATVIGVFLIPVTYYVMERFAIRFGKKPVETVAAEGGGAPGHAPPGNPAGKEGDPHA
jgi:HAE1 family hydrophobic/amphiphilic exporter-1